MHHIISTTAALKEACDRLASEEFVTVDTEFIREKTYYPKLCLVQLGGSDFAVAVDPLAEGIDLTPLFDLLKNPAVLKVLHAAKQDLEIFYHLMDEMPHPLYDTQVAAMVCGYGEQVGYEALVNRMLHEQLDKASRYTDWAKRPLTQRQVDYAIGDVTYLRSIYEKFRTQIKIQKRCTWIEEEMARLEDPELFLIHPEDAWKKLKYKKRKPAYLNTLRAVAAWRERKAQRKNLPRSWVMKDEMLLQIAAMNPENMEELSEVRGSKNLSENSRRQMLDELEKARQVDKADYPEDEKVSGLELSPAQEGLLDVLRLLLKQVCDEAGVATKLVANKHDLMAFVAAREEAVLAHGWRYELFGHIAEGFLKGKISLTVNAKGDGLTLIDTDAHHG
jgi:ribonuclease D